MRILSFLARFADTLRVATFGPDVLAGPRRQPPTRIPTDSALADALGLTRVELVSDPGVTVKAHTRKAPSNPKREALHAALGRAVRR